MRPWRSHTMVVVVGAAILLAMLSVLEWLSRRYRQREQRAEARLIEAERLESIGRFAGGVAHDVGNLLRVVRSAVILLRRQSEDKSKAENLLDQIDGTLTVGGELVNQLLFYARAGRSEVEYLDLNFIVSEALPILKRAVGPLIDIEVSYDGASVICLTNVAQFQAILLNLVLNSRDAMPRGGRVSLAVRAVADVDGKWDEVSVSDNGTGMPHDILRQAFDPFFTTKGIENGHGLGLSQVRAFIEYCQGSLEVESQPGHGTVIRLRLPSRFR